MVVLFLCCVKDVMCGDEEAKKHKIGNLCNTQHIWDPQKAEIKRSTIEVIKSLLT
jgi:hypothetical protein